MRVAVIGASAGLGAAIAVHHRHRGDTVIAVARRHDRLDQLAHATDHPHAETEEHRQGPTPEAQRRRPPRPADRASPTTHPRPDQWQSIHADITTTEGRHRTVEAIRDAHRIYYVAGVAADPAATFATNVIAPARLAEATDRADLQLVLVSSLAAVVAFPELGTYCASKAALEQWAACHQVTSRADVLVIRPGQFPSEFHTGPQPFDMAALPHERGETVARLADRKRRGLHTLGGRRDQAAALSSRLIGPNLARKLL
jgi:short-subunit dehydrogenase